MQAGSIDAQELHDPLKAPLDLGIHVADRGGNQARGELGEQALEAEALGEQLLGTALARLLEQENPDENRLEEDQPAPHDDVPSVAPRRRCLLVGHLAFGAGRVSRRAEMSDQDPEEQTAQRSQNVRGRMETGCHAFHI